MLCDVGGGVLMEVVAKLVDDDRAELTIDDATTQPLVRELWGAYIRTIEGETCLLYTSPSPRD